ncbi:MAG TPA: OsmC family protein [Polyangiales bacterium]
MSNPAKQQSTARFNGLDTEALTQAVAGIAADPSLAPVTFRAKTRWQGGFRSRTDVESYDMGGQRFARRHQIFTDEPVELLGDNSAPNPQDLILTALASCMTVGFVVGATNLGVRIDSLEISTECTLDLRGAFGLDPSIPPGAPRIPYTVRVKGSGTREQYEEILRNVTMISPNYYHLSRPIQLDATLELVG